MPPNSTISDARVVFTPSGKRGHFPVGTPILYAAQALGVDVDSVCGGRGYVDAVRLSMLRETSPNTISTQNLKIFLQ